MAKYLLVNEQCDVQPQTDGAQGPGRALPPAERGWVRPLREERTEGSKQRKAGSVLPSLPVLWQSCGPLLRRAQPLAVLALNQYAEKHGFSL